MSYRQDSKRNFQVIIYESEYRQIQAWVDKYQNLETGGDLFGLWSDDHTAVVQLVLGPGENCRRSGVSFYQDVDYLDRIGNQMTQNEGLCHIGEWHSHHKLGLSRPSGGDENTVWSNMDRYGIYRFCLFIANISSSWSQKGSIQDDVTVNGFLFEINRDKSQLPVLQGKFKPIREKSPFRLKNIDEINKGAESVKEEEENVYVPVKRYKSDGKKTKYQEFEMENMAVCKEPADKYSESKSSGHTAEYQALVEVNNKNPEPKRSLCHRLHYFVCYLCWGSGCNLQS
jgi:hypothetical protein